MEADWLNHLRHRFIVFDGPDGSGKSTQFRRFAHKLQSAGIEVCEVREPGGTLIGEQIRKVLLDPANTDMDLRCEMLLYMASRAQLVFDQIRPALARGALVLADRFISSTLAYQGSAGGLPLGDIRQVGRVALGECWPDLFVIFDVDQATAMARMSPLVRPQEFIGHDHDRMEAKGSAFHRTVRAGYLQQAAEDPAHYLVIDATADADTVTQRLETGLAQRFASP